MKMDKKNNLGQFFTPDNICKKMISLIQNTGSILEPSCGNGAFLQYLPKDRTIGIDIDKDIIPSGAIVMDFFDWNQKVDTIIGNPPYVKFQNIPLITKNKLPNKFDNRTNLYIFFIDKCIDLLNSHGELIFIVPRDFIKATYANNLNNRLFNEGGFSYWEELGDTKIFSDASPNTVIFRWEKNAKHTIPVSFYNGYLTFSEENKNKNKIYINQLFDVMVGGASGANNIFIENTGNIDLVVSTTKSTGLTKKAHYVKNPTPYLEQYKDQLLSRKIKNFNENNWWEWGRKIRYIDKDKIYVNMRTRDLQPFFTHSSGWFDGSLLALVPKENNSYSIQKLINILNNTDWEAQGFKVGGRLIFGQRSLSNAFIII